MQVLSHLWSPSSQKSPCCFPSCTGTGKLCWTESAKESRLIRHDLLGTSFYGVPACTVRTLMQKPARLGARASFSVFEGCWSFSGRVSYWHIFESAFAVAVCLSTVARRSRICVVVGCPLGFPTGCPTPCVPRQKPPCILNYCCFARSVV